LHVTVQQMPAVQCPLVHWASPVHGAPLPPPDTHVPPMQLAPVTQSALVEQVVLQVAPPHLKSPQGVSAPPMLQWPMPSHVDCAAALLLFVPSVHAAALHTVPDAYSTHAEPSALHAPLWPQDEVASMAQGVAQQMPITHAPLEHWRFPMHAPPLAATPQTMLWQSVDAQSAPTAHPWPLGQIFPTASQLAPPQSTPVSLPSFTPSMQDTQVPGPLPKQSLVVQSVLTLQCFLSGHFGHVGPPQSTSVSCAFCTPSLQVAG
jgi:hypothetical protein